MNNIVILKLTLPKGMSNNFEEDTDEAALWADTLSDLIATATEKGFGFVGMEDK